MAHPWRSTWIRLVAAAAGAVAAAVAAVTVMAAPASAQITLGATSAPSGSRVDGTGSGFSRSGSNVGIQLGRSGGATLWSGPADHGGSIVFSFVVPNVAPGSYSVVARQTDPEGDPVDGTPASARLQVTAASSPAPSGTGPVNQPGQQVPPQQGNPQPSGIHPQTQGEGTVSNVSSEAAVPPLQTATVPPPATQVSGSTVAHPSTRLLEPPPQVAMLWRMAGSVPKAGPQSVALTTPNQTPLLTAPEAAAGSRDAPSGVTLAALAMLILSAMVVIATTLQLRTAKLPPVAPAVAPLPEAPRRRRSSRRSATLSSDWWSGSPARLR